MKAGHWAVTMSPTGDQAASSRSLRRCPASLGLEWSRRHFLGRRAAASSPTVARAEAGPKKTALTAVAIAAPTRAGVGPHQVQDLRHEPEQRHYLPHPRATHPVFCPERAWASRGRWTDIEGHYRPRRVIHHAAPRSTYSILGVIGPEFLAQLGDPAREPIERRLQLILGVREPFHLLV
jgi:hypothetical protein